MKSVWKPPKENCVRLWARNNRGEILLTFVEEVAGIYRLRVPFEDLYTSVFLIRTEQGDALVDSGTYPSDVTEYILPALQEFGLRLADVRYLIFTHQHGDHTGGKTTLLALAPTIEVVQEKRALALNGISVCEMKGHTLDCIGVLDERRSTLISGDGLQGAGVGKYRCSLASKDEYLSTVEKLIKDERITNILFSHAYEPWYKDGAFGREEVMKCLQDCVRCVQEK